MNEQNRKLQDRKKRQDDRNRYAYGSELSAMREDQHMGP